MYNNSMEVFWKKIVENEDLFQGFEKMSVDYTKQKCLVCGDKASGLHYTVISCESCKSFFGRKIKSKAKFTCEANGNCVMDLYTRRHCPACRLKKCLDVGMKPERVWDEKRLETRKPLERKNKKKQNHQQQQQQQAHQQQQLQQQSPQQTVSPQPCQGPVNSIQTMRDEKFPKLLPDQEELIRCLEKAKVSAKTSNKVHQPNGRFDEILEKMKTSLDLGSQNSNGLQSLFGSKGFALNGFKPDGKMRISNSQNCPLNLSMSGEDGIMNDVDVTRMMPSGYVNGQNHTGLSVKQEVMGHTDIDCGMGGMPEIDPNNPPDSLLYNMTLMGCVIRQTVAFTKGIPMFRELTYEDQAVLIKNAILEVLILRCAECFVPEKNAVIDDITGSEWSYDAMMSSGFGTSAEPTLKFVQTVNAMNLTKEEYALLQAITIISPDRPDLMEKERIEDIQRPMVMTLQNLCKITHPDDKLLFAKLIMKLTDVREVVTRHISDIMQMKLPDNQFEQIFPLINEIFSL
ncbi:vitamin D3 receptor B-like isoform X2 [Antedon mediterranea]|uniref:vitamin D3 receptor B-like isoform X2 n=1 Tax=Antedon mediterranea TaxID=105859 RepID=UPI003AF8FD1C